MKVVINRCYGGWSLSEEAGKKLGIQSNSTFTSNIHECILEDVGMSRTDPRVIEVVESMGREASGTCAKLEVIEIPDDVEWEVNDYDGKESIHEVHRVWE